MQGIGSYELVMIAGVCGGIVVLALFVAGLILTISGARKRRRPEGGSSVGLIIGIICLVLSACLGCSLVGVVLTTFSGQM